jgi:hypothetical protein
MLTMDPGKPEFPRNELLEHHHLMHLTGRPDTVTVAFLRPTPKPDGRGTFKTGERAVFEYDAALRLCCAGAAARVKG